MQASLFDDILERNPDEASLCLPVVNAYGEIVKTICTDLMNYPVYLLEDGIHAFLKTSVVKNLIDKMDWQFVEDYAWAHHNADLELSDEERELVQKRFMMFIKTKEETSDSGFTYTLME
jgi:hypothetical protein